MVRPGRARRPGPARGAARVALARRLVAEGPRTGVRPVRGGGRGGGHRRTGRDDPRPGGSRAPRVVPDRRRPADPTLARRSGSGSLGRWRADVHGRCQEGAAPELPVPGAPVRADRRGVAGRHAASGRALGPVARAAGLRRHLRLGRLARQRGAQHALLEPDPAVHLVTRRLGLVAPVPSSWSAPDRPGLRRDGRSVLRRLPAMSARSPSRNASSSTRRWSWQRS